MIQVMKLIEGTEKMKEYAHKNGFERKNMLTHRSKLFYEKR